MKIQMLLAASFLGVALFAGTANADTNANICAQSELNALGYYSGEINGKLDAATKAAGEQYIVYMKAHNPGWNQPSLTNATGVLWCRQMSAARPDELAKFEMAYNGPGTSLVRIDRVEVKGPTIASQPYNVAVGFKVYGKTGVIVDGACFTWNGRDNLCFDIPGGSTKSPIVVALTTGRVGNYGINARIKYHSGGLNLVSGESSVDISVTK